MKQNREINKFENFSSLNHSRIADNRLQFHIQMR